jgi:MFS family permease
MQQEAKTYRELFSRCSKLIAVSVVLHMHRDIDLQLFQPFFFSRVRCCGSEGPELTDVVTYAGRDLELRVTAETCQCDLAATFGGSYNTSIGACDVPFVPRDSAMWSHSSHCSNFQYVQMEMQTLFTAWNAQQSLWYVPLMAVFGKISDTYGRRSVFYHTTLFTVLIFMTFTVDAWLGPLPDWVIYATAPFQCSAYVHDIVGWSMAIDLVPEPVDQAKLFPLLVPILSGTVASTVGDGIAFFVLKLHLVDYTVVWLVLTIVAAAACIFILTLPETLAHRKPFVGVAEYIRDVTPTLPWCGSGIDSSDEPSGSTVSGYGYELFCAVPQQGDTSSASHSPPRERQRIMLVLLFLTNASVLAWGSTALTANYMFGVMHFLQEERIFVSLFAKAASIFAAAVAAALIPRLGAWRSLLLGTLFASSSTAAFISLPGKSGAYVSPLLASIGDALATPSRMIYMASILTPSEITRAQVRKRSFLSAVYLQMLILPRQARVRHKRKTQNKPSFRLRSPRCAKSSRRQRRPSLPRCFTGVVSRWIWATG